MTQEPNLTGFLIGFGAAADTGTEGPGPGQGGAGPPLHEGGLLRWHVPVEDHQRGQAVPGIGQWQDH